jgi:hypothetical protein
MTSLHVADQLSALRNAVFGAIESWNTAHPHPLRSHREHGSVNVTQVYADATGIPSYSIVVVCALSGTAHLTFHGHDIAAIAEHARFTLEHRIAAELKRRADKAYEDEFDRRYGVAV